MGQTPIALQLRYLQTLTEIATEKNSTVVFPLPIDMISSFMNSLAGGQANSAQPRVPPPGLPEDDTPRRHTIPVATGE